MAIVFFVGLLTSLGPCSLSLLPITLAYLSGFENKQNPFLKSLNFCSGIVLSLVLLGSISGIFGKIYGQVPLLIPNLVAVIAILMGLNLLGLLKLRFPTGPNPDNWKEKVPASIAPMAAGLAFGLASSPCSTPILAVLLGWIAQTRDPLIGIVLLTCFGAGQIMPLFLAGSAAANVNQLLAFKPIGKWIPPLSGVILLTTGVLTLMARWI